MSVQISNVKPPEVTVRLKVHPSRGDIKDWVTLTVLTFSSRVQQSNSAATIQFLIYRWKNDNYLILVLYGPTEIKLWFDPVYADS